MVSFADPARLWLLAAPVIAALLTLLRHRRRLKLQRRLASPGVWRRLLGGTPATGVLRMMAWSVAAALVVLALARPQWGEIPAEESIRTRDLVVALDVSDSMLCPDLQPSRLERSVEALVRLLPALEGNRVAVVVFAGDAYPLVPLTTDLAAVAAFLDGIQPGMVALPGSNLERAVDTAVSLLPEEGEGRVLVLFTDGENLQGDLQRAASVLREAGAGMIGVVAGTERGGPIPEVGEGGVVRYKRDMEGQPVITHAHPEVLADVAGAVNGTTVNLADREVIAEISAAVAELRTREVETTRTVHRIDRFPLFLGAAAVFLTLGFALSPWRRVTVATLLLLLAVTPDPANAQGASQPVSSSPPTAAPAEALAGDALPVARPSWWQRLVPGGGRRLARRGVSEWKAADIEAATEAFAGAAELDPEQPARLYDLGTALAAQERLEAAVPLLERADQGGVPGATYNAGTAALEGRQLEAAVSWLRKAVLADANDVEAKHNFELALRQLEQQKDKDQKEDQEEKDQQDKEQQPEQNQPQDESNEPQPTPQPKAGQGAQPTPTPDPNQPVFAALERAEAEARQAMRSPTPKVGKVEKDW
ncbi:MAG: VWA domain-containing protein [Thermoanaerobaculales bacterium]